MFQDASTKEEETHDVLKKYNKFRKQKLQAAKKPWYLLTKII